MKVLHSILLLARRLQSRSPLQYSHTTTVCTTSGYHSMSDPQYHVQSEPSLLPNAKDCDVYISTCRNIFYNLALEEWLYENVDFTNRNLLMLWRNDPCVVIGRHQNPWLECDLSLCKKLGIPVARRKSGGGTVFHDNGNMNCTFFTKKQSYDRKSNLAILASVLQSKWDLDISVNCRDDLLLQDRYKISGTAAKLGSKTAYHHCTLLLNTDKSILSAALKSQMEGVTSRATVSVRSETRNLAEVNPDVNYGDLVEEVAREYLSYYSAENKPTFIDPTRENKFPGLLRYYQNLKQWEWIYGKSPKFSVERTFDEFPDSQHPIGISLRVAMTMEKGHISDITLCLSGYPQNLQPHDVNILCRLLQDHWRGRRFWVDEFSSRHGPPHIRVLSDSHGREYEPDAWGFNKELLAWMEKCLSSMLLI